MSGFKAKSSIKDRKKLCTKHHTFLVLSADTNAPMCICMQQSMPHIPHCFEVSANSSKGRIQAFKNLEQNFCSQVCTCLHINTQNVSSYCIELLASQLLEQSKCVEYVWKKGKVREMERIQVKGAQQISRFRVCLHGALVRPREV